MENSTPFQTKLIKMLRRWELKFIFNLHLIFIHFPLDMKFFFAKMCTHSVNWGKKKTEKNQDEFHECSMMDGNGRDGKRW
jgi:hypothetical protein